MHLANQAFSVRSTHSSKYGHFWQDGWYHGGYVHFFSTVYGLDWQKVAQSEPRTRPDVRENIYVYVCVAECEQEEK